MEPKIFWSARRRKSLWGGSLALTALDLLNGSKSRWVIMPWRNEELTQYRKKLREQ